MWKYVESRNSMILFHVCTPCEKGWLPLKDGFINSHPSSLSESVCRLLMVSRSVAELAVCGVCGVCGMLPEPRKSQGGLGIGIVLDLFVLVELPCHFPFNKQSLNKNRFKMQVTTIMKRSTVTSYLNHLRWLMTSSWVRFTRKKRKNKATRVLGKSTYGVPCHWFSLNHLVHTSTHYGIPQEKGK